MEKIKQGVNLFLLGTKDIIYGFSCLISLFLSKDTDSNRQSLQRFPSNRDTPQKSVFDILLQCVVFSFMFWIPYYVFNHVLLDNVYMQFVIFMGDDLKYAMWWKSFLYSVFFIFWVAPLILISKVLNFCWYQEISHFAINKISIKKNSSITFTEIWDNESKSYILQVMYCVQAYVVYFLPLPTIIQTLWYLVHLSFLSSLYAFEYKWGHMGWSLQRRLLTIDRKWPYFLGFGLPLAAASTFARSFMDSTLIYSILFTVYVLSSTFTDESQRPAFIYPVHSFKFVQWLTDFCIITWILSWFIDVKHIRR